MSDEKYPNLPPGNRKVVKEYYNRCIARGQSSLGLKSKVCCLSRMSKLLGKPFQEATTQDIEGLMVYIETNGYAESTKTLYKFVLKSFYGKEDSRVAWIRVRRAYSNPKLPEELITREELQYLMSKCKHKDKKALLMFLYDSAVRPREFLMLRRKHIIPDGNGMFVMIPKAKTPARTIYLVESRPFLDDIPFGKLKYGGLKSFFFITLNSKIGKRLYPYILRHSRITELARKGWNESHLCKFAGWKLGSPMASVYIHLSQDDLKNIMLKTVSASGQASSCELSHRPTPQWPGLLYSPQ